MEQCECNHVCAWNHGCGEYAGDGANGARKCGAFSSSSLINYYEPDLVVDGVTAEIEQDWTGPYGPQSSSCWFSDGGRGDVSSWLQVDLGHTAFIDKVAVYNMKGNWGRSEQQVYMSQLPDHETGVLCIKPDDYDDPNLFGVTAAGDVKFFECEFAAARYITIDSPVRM